MENNKVLSLSVSTLSFQETLAFILANGKLRKPSYCCFANVHMTIEAYDNTDFATQVNQADLVCADGMPLVKASKLLNNQHIERVAGMDMMPAVMEKAAQQNQSVFFFGTTDDVLTKIETEAKKRFPNLKIAGTFSPPFRSLTNEEKQGQINLINSSDANLVMVALGCPKQEKWMAEHSKHINAVLLGVGGAFPVFAQLQSRAPKWIRSLSLEWLYRLSQDPKRLFKRYFYTNTKFIMLLAKHYFRK